MTTPETTTETTTEIAAAPKAVDDNVVRIDLNHLTIDEIETIEDITDAPIDAVSDPRARKGRLLRAVGYVVKRRENPDFKLEDAGGLRVDFASETSDPTVSDD